MKKRVGLSASYSKHEFRLKKHKLLKDDSRISELPDEVLVSILSLLTITEAARTSVLSHRWKKLWTFFNGSLNFDVTKRLFGVPEKFWPQEMSKYSALMNQVLHMLVGSSTLDDFTVRFGSLDKYSKCHFDRCVEFAMGKRIQRLELDMNPIELASSGGPSYNFPNEFYAWIKQPCGLYIISALTSLTLNHINVSGEFIEFFLSNCPLLERLCVVDSQHLSKLKVTGAAARKLRYLEISHCSRVESVEISAPNLLSFAYIGNVIQLHVENAPQLVEVSIGHDVIPYLCSSLSNYLSEIETLKLEFELEVNKKFTQFLALNKLKHLILRVDIVNEGSLLGWTSLIVASPCLQKFTLEADTTKSKSRRKVKKVTAKHPHQCLKVVELVGFTGCASDMELAMYFLANATTLEQIIIDRRDPIVRGTPFEFEEVNFEETKKRSVQLKKYLPPGVDFVLI